MVHIRCVEGVNGCKRTSGDLLVTQRSGPAKVSTSGTQWSLVGHFIHPRLTLCCSNSCLEIIILVQSVGCPPLQSLHMGYSPTYRPQFVSFKTWNYPAPWNKKIHEWKFCDSKSGGFWKFQIVSAVNGTKVDLTSRWLPTKVPFSWLQNPDTRPAGAQFPISILENNNLILSPASGQPTSGGYKGWSPVGLF